MTELEGMTEFQKWIEDLVTRAGGWRKAAKQGGLSHATLMKAAGKIEGGMDVKTLVAISEWSNVPLAYVLNLYVGGIEMDQRLAMEIERLRQLHPELTDALVVAAELGQEELQDVLEYIQFKVSRRS